MENTKVNTAEYERFYVPTPGELKEAGTDDAKIQKHLDSVEYEQTRDIDFSSHM